MAPRLEGNKMDFLEDYIKEMDSGDFIQIYRDQSGKWIVISGSITSGIVVTGFGETLQEAYDDER